MVVTPNSCPVTKDRVPRTQKVTAKLWSWLSVTVILAGGQVTTRTLRFLLLGSVRISLGGDRKVP